MLDLNAVSKAYAQVLREIVLPDARAAHEAGEIEKRDRLLDQAESLLDKIIGSMPADSRPNHA